MENIKWAARVSAPANYPISGPHISYFRDGKKIGGVSALFGISQIWSSAASARSVSNSGYLPDSLYISYFGLNNKNQTFLYEGGTRLPLSKFEMIFKDDYIEDNEKKKYSEIMTGLAPGGRVCVWVDHVEIFRFKVNEIEKWSDSILVSAADEEDFKNVYRQTMDYLRHHPVDYSIWEKSDPRYDLDLGFCSEDSIANFLGYTLYSKEGVVQPVAPIDIDITQWGKPYGKKVDFYGSNSYQLFEERDIKDSKLHLPVHIFFQWEKKGNIFYSTEVVMPKDFEQRFLKTYINPNTGKEANYNRIVLGVEKGGEYAIVWVDGPGKQEKIIRFKGVPENIHGTNVFNKEKYPTEITYY